MTTPADDDADDEVLVAYLARALADVDAGKVIDLLALCDGRPDLVPQLAAALGLSAQLPALHQHSVAADEPVAAVLAGRYRLLQAIGRGAAGTVYRARDERLQRDVAVKVLHRGLFAGNDAEARFEREAITLAAHEHPHIVRIHDQGRADDGSTFLVTELLNGRSLHEVLEAARTAMPAGPAAQMFGDRGWLAALLPNASLETSYLRQVVRWAAELGDGLTAAHAAGICHRDVKPSNAFVRTDGRIVLLDFGIAARSGDAAITHANTVLGTPSYMAPEQASGAQRAEPTLDVYGLGATLYHLLTHRAPHAGDLGQVLLAVRNDEPERASRLHRGLPRDLQAMLDQALAKNPSHRYPTMAAMVADLWAFLDHQPVAARPLGPVRRTWRRMRRRPARTLAIASSLAVVVLATLAIPAWSAVNASADAIARQQLLAALPADLCIEGRPEMLALVPIGERTDIVAELDRLLDLDRRDLAVRLFRALAALDAGQLANARADLAAINVHSPSAYLRAVAARYDAALATTRGVGIVDLQGLPEPTEVQDCFVAGFHALRAGDCERADELLTRAQSYLPARDLRLLAILGLRKRDPQRAFAEAKELEGIYGRPTARTRHTLGAAMLQLQQWEAAIPYCEHALRLRPDRHGPLNNLALAHLRLGHLEQARDAYQLAVRLKPWLDNSRSGLCQTLRRLGKYDEARATAESMNDQGWREYELGNLEVARALEALAQNDPVAKVAAATAAGSHFAAAAASAKTTNPKAAGVPASLRFAEALASERADDALGPLLGEMRSEPRNARQIANLAAMLADAELGENIRNHLRLWLLDLAIDLAPDDAEYRRYRERLLGSLPRR